MLLDGVAWQEALGRYYIMMVAYTVVMLLGLVSGIFNWWILLTALCLATGFFILIGLIPLALNLSRSFFVQIIVCFLIHILVTLVAFAFHHYSAGLMIGPKEHVYVFFLDAFYFSVTTFTTLGYGDFQPTPEMRLATSLEALDGMASVAFTISIIFLWCEENLVPKEMAVLDGKRVHKKAMAFGRVRVRTITGKERDLKNWDPVPEDGEVYYYDDHREEWVKAATDALLPEGVSIIRFSPRKRRDT